MGFNQILEKFWVGYQFSSSGDLLPVVSREHKELIERVVLLGEADLKYKIFLKDYKESISLSVGRHIDAVGVGLKASRALESLALVLAFGVDKNRKVFNKATDKLFKDGVISKQFKNELNKYWKYLCNTYRHGTTNIESPNVSILQARLDLIKMSEFTSTLISNREQPISELGKESKD